MSIDDAIKDLDAGGQADPKLPFVHFNLGLAYVQKQDYERARERISQGYRQRAGSPFCLRAVRRISKRMAGNDVGEPREIIATHLNLDPQRAGFAHGLSRRLRSIESAIRKHSTGTRSGWFVSDSARDRQRTLPARPE